MTWKQEFKNTKRILVLTKNKENQRYMDEDEAKYHLYKFLRSNVTFATDLISGVQLFPFQHLADEGHAGADYFLGIWVVVCQIF